MSRKIAARLLFLLVNLTGAGSLNAAGAADTSLADYKQANSALREDLSSGKAPAGMSNTGYAKLVSSAFDMQIVSTAKDQPLPAFMDICDEAGRTKTAYILFGLKKGELAKEPNAGARLAQLESQNYLRFQDELIASLRFTVACSAVMAQKMEVVAGQWKPEDMTPARRSGAQQFQRGLAEIVSGAALSVFDPVRPENRLAVLDLVARNIDSLTAAMSPEGRQVTAASVDKVLARPGLSPDVKEKLGKVRQALNRPDCGRLCSLH